MNDNPPIFSQSIYHVNITETTVINTIVSTAISAYDPDSGVSGIFSYYLQNNLSSYAVRENWLKKIFFQSHFYIVLVLFSISQFNKCKSGFSSNTGL